MVITPNQPTISRHFAWELGIDTGGTFTDCIAIHASGTTKRAKVLSSSAMRGRVVRAARNGLILTLARTPTAEVADAFCHGFAVVFLGPHSTEVNLGTVDRAHVESGGQLSITFTGDDCASHTLSALEGALVDLVAPFESPILAARLALDRPHPLPLDDCRISLGTTRGTNALLEGRVSEVTLFVNEGLEDLLRIGDQRRSHIFDRSPRRAAPLERSSCPVRGRMSAAGIEQLPLDVDDLRARARALVTDGARVAAVALLHGGRNPAHERAAEATLRDAGFQWVSVASSCGSTSRFEPRARAAVVDAALSGPVGTFVAAIQRDASGAEILMMTSAGGLVPAEHFQPRESLLSGPAGGVAGAAAIAAACGFSRCVTLDMGGTSADVARVDKTPELRDETTVGAATIATPSIAVESVAAGGGSLLWWDGDAMRVGPSSAGAVPGAACYGQGGPLTLTDAHLLLGRIDPEKLPIPIKRSCALDRAIELHRTITESQERSLSLEEMLEAFIALADEAIANAIRAVTVRRGVDPAGHALVAFGGAGGLHACAVAERLGVSTVLFPPDAGLLCARGISRAPVNRVVSSLVLVTLDEFARDSASRWDSLEARARSVIAELGVDPIGSTIGHRTLFIRQVGQEEALSVECDSDFAHATVESLRCAFTASYRATYGFDPEPRRAIEVERIRLQIEATRQSAPIAEPALADDLTTGPPCCVMRSDSTFHWPIGWQAHSHPSGALIFSRTKATTQDERGHPGVSSVMAHELTAAQLGSIASDMGEQLRRTALSPNIKDRLDFSCGILDSDGLLVVNAPHIPIHLGALGPCVRSLVPTCSFSPGDVIAVNHPRFGGSHLPDITVVTPVHSATGVLIGYAANRAHHAEIGGMRPGSMPPRATMLGQEGVVIEPTLIVQGGTACFETIEHQLRNATWPSRMVDDNLADLRAQVAANEVAAQRVRALFAQRGAHGMAASYAALRTAASRASERAIAALPARIDRIEERLDDGSLLAVAIHRTLSPPRLTIDFTSTSPQHPRNLNAPRAVTRAAIMYSMRVLVGLTLGPEGPSFPMNEGLLDPVTIVLPDGTILSPDFSGSPEACPACAIGQTETSQRLVDLLWRALNLAACSQGTINNVLFGNGSFGFYETIAGGAGATADADGASGVHTHISNTRITDAEVLERRYPVVLERFAVRTGSGGNGARRGGDGLIRRIRFMQAVELSFLSQHRIEFPYGLAGGSPGMRGTQRVIRANGDSELVPGIVELTLNSGDAFEVETPGGGGYGS